MNLLHKPSKILITGQSGTGKSTYFTRYVLNSFHTSYESILVFDHQGEMSYRLQIEPANTIEDLAEQYYRGLVVFDPAILFPGQTFEAWNFFAEWTFERSKQCPQVKRLLAVDELQMFSSTADFSDELAQVIETGRKYSLDFLGITQQLNLVHNRLRNQMTELVVFRHEDKLILDALEEKGFNNDDIRSLAVGEYIDRHLLTGQISKGNVFDNASQKPTLNCEVEADGESAESEAPEATNEIEE